VGEAAALLSRCDLYVGNDTGMLNVAAAVGTRAIGLFGASPPLRHSRRIHVLEPEAGNGMCGIAPADVLERMQALMDGTAA